MDNPVNKSIGFEGKNYQVFAFSLDENKTAYQQALLLRKSVFVEEQGVSIDIEVDDIEDECVHWLINDEQDNPVAVARCREYQEGCQMRPVLKLERIAVAKDQRGKNLGLLIMQQLTEYADHEGHDQLLLSAQEGVIEFYKKLGFEGEGAPFIEAGISHLWMRKML